jgi:hypothetical protein
MSMIADIEDEGDYQHVLSLRSSLPRGRLPGFDRDMAAKARQLGLDAPTR